MFHYAQLFQARVRAGKVECGPIPSGTVPIPWGTMPPLTSGEAEPPSGGWRWPPGGSKSFHKILMMPPHKPRPCSTVPGCGGHGYEQAKRSAALFCRAPL